MQQLFPLESGNYFKMTVAHFLSPLGHQINKIGVTPDLLIEKSDPIKAAQLILSPASSAENKNEYVQFSLSGMTVEIDTRLAREQEYWQAYAEILDRIGIGLAKGTTEGWKSISTEDLADRRLLYYPTYKLGNKLSDVPIDKIFTVYFPHDINTDAISPSNIELIAADSGERVPFDLKTLSDSQLQIVPEQTLKPGATYWITVHPGIKYANDSSLDQGTVFNVTVQP
jgi:carboxyl-terminal processing protease